MLCYRRFLLPALPMKHGLHTCKECMLFWNAILFAEKGFDGNPMQKHMTLPIDEKHFNQWLSLFHQTIDELFAGPKAEEAKQRAKSIAQIMNFKISVLKTPVTR